MTPTLRPFFIVGNERSGTTMLRLMLDEHSRLHIPLETFFILPLIERFDTETPLSASAVRDAFKIVRTDRDWSLWQLDEAEVSKRLDELSKPYLRDVVSTIFEYSCEKENKIRWGNKTPTYVSYITEIDRLLPCAKFLHIIRDPRDVCVSMLHVGWHGNTVRQIASRWRDQVEAGIQEGRKLGSTRYLEVLYEDLVLNSQETLETVCRFLEEPYEDQMLEFHRSKAIKQMHQPEFHQKTRRAPEASDVARWRHELRPLQVIVVENIAGNTLRKLGYEARYSGVLRILPTILGGIIWFANVTLPVRRKLGLHFPNFSGKL